MRRAADGGQHVGHLSEMEHLFYGDLGEAPLPTPYHQGLRVGQTALADIALDRIGREQIDASQAVFQLRGARQKVDELFASRHRRDMTAIGLRSDGDNCQFGTLPSHTCLAKGERGAA